MAATGSVNCSGAITATIEWQGAGERPKCVIIKEVATVGWGGSSGSCSDGLGGTPVNGATSGSSTMAKYTVETNPGATITRTRSPSASASLPTQQLRMNSAIASVSYAVEVIPVELVVAGGTHPNDPKRFLVGQGMTASLNTGGFTQSGHSWSVSGGEPFNEWAPTLTSSAGADMNLVTNAATLHCYFRKQQLSTVTCAATIATPSGNLSVNAEAKVTVESPTSTFTSPVGEVLAAEIPPPAATGYYEIGLYPPGGTATATQKGGVTWRAVVTLPAGYSGTGKFYFMNICTKPARSSYGSAGSKTLNINGTPSLDKMIKYDGKDFDTGANYSDYVSDNPGQPTSPGHEQVNISTEEFETYLMFTPPGSDVKAVPLKRAKWWWKGQIICIPPALPQLSFEGQNSEGAEECIVHPSWSNNTSNAVLQ